LRIAYFNEPAGDTADELMEYWGAAAWIINLFRDQSGGVKLSGLAMAGNARRGKVGLVRRLQPEVRRETR